MIDNLVFSLNATMPIFIMMVIGYILKKINFLDAHSTGAINKLVFRVFLPALLFTDLIKYDFVALWDSSFVGFCAITTVISIIVSLFLSLIWKKRTDQGEFIQASYRSAAATLGIAFMTNIYDSTAMVALMIIGSVPIYNVVAVLILSLTAKSDDKGNAADGRALALKTFKNVITNPIILGIIVGLVWSLLKVPTPHIMLKSLTYLGNCASPLALIGLGASFEFSNLKKELGAIININFNKLFLFCILFLPVAAYMGFRDEKMVSALIMLGSATTSSSFIMAKNMGHEGSVSSCAVMTTTLFSSFTLTLWLFILRSLGYI